MLRVAVNIQGWPPCLMWLAASWMDLAVGNGYNFPLISPALKSVFGYNQKIINIMGMAHALGENAGGYLPALSIRRLNLSPCVVSLVGAILCICGYGIIWLVICQIINLHSLSLRLLLLTVMVAFASNSNTWFAKAAVSTNMRNFPETGNNFPRLVAGVFFAIYMLLYIMHLNDGYNNLLLVLAIGIPILCGPMYYIVYGSAFGGNPPERFHFDLTQAGSVGLAFFKLATLIMSVVSDRSDAVSLQIAIVVIIVTSHFLPVKATLNSEGENIPQTTNVGNNSSTGEEQSSITSSPNAHNPIVKQDATIPWRTPSSPDANNAIVDDDATIPQPRRTPSSPDANNTNTNEDLTAPLLETSSRDANAIVNRNAGDTQTQPAAATLAENLTFRQAVATHRFWLLWMLYSIGSGSGVTVYNNVAQIGAAFGIHDTSALSAAFGFGNFVCSAAVSECFNRSRRTPRTVWMTCAEFLMAGIYLWLAFASTPVELYAAITLLGICSRILYSGMVSTAYELFGGINFVDIYYFMLFGNFIGAIPSSAIAGFFYDWAAPEQGQAICKGLHCFRTTFFALAPICALGATFGIALTCMLRPAYQLLPAEENLHDQPQDADH